MARESIGDVRIRKNDSKGTVVRLLVRHHGDDVTAHITLENGKANPFGWSSFEMIYQENVGRAVVPRRIGFLYCGEPEFSDKTFRDSLLRTRYRVRATLPAWSILGPIYRELVGGRAWKQLRLSALYKRWSQFFYGSAWMPKPWGSGSLCPL